MRKRLLRAMLLLALLATVMTLALVFSRLYDVFAQRAYGEMQSAASLISLEMARDEDALALLEEAQQKVPHLRVSWIDAEGTVRYDSGIADTSSLDSHESREEVSEALESGEGTSSRPSASLGENTYYYAVRLADGTVLRLAQTQRSVVAELLGLLPSLLLIALAVMGLSALLSGGITRRVLGPVNQLDIDHPGEADAYEELTPLLKRLKEQRAQIDAQVKAAEESARQATAILDNMAEGLLILSADGKVLSMNRSATTILSPAEPAYKDKHYAAVLRNLPLHDAIQQGLESRAETEAKVAIGERTYHVLISPVLLETAMTGAIVLLLDITEREVSEQMRREFSANVSHELKTPLTTIMGYAEMISTGMAAKGDVQLLGERIRVEARHLVALIEDIIALSRLDETSAPAATEPVDLYALAQGVIERLTPAAAEKTVSLHLGGTACILPEGMPPLLTEMLHNLVDNAIRYNTPEGEVRLRVWQDDQGAHVSVQDTGVGIDKIHHDRIFERFYRVDKSHSRETGGTGLGLSIVKHCVQIHSGRLSLESAPQKGTRIDVCFPFASSK